MGGRLYEHVGLAETAECVAELLASVLAARPCVAGGLSYAEMGWVVWGLAGARKTGTLACAPASGAGEVVGRMRICRERHSNKNSGCTIYTYMYGMGCTVLLTLLYAGLEQE